MNIKNDQMRSEIAEGLLYTHSRANSNTAKLLEVSSFAYAVIELLAEKRLRAAQKGSRLHGLLLKSYWSTKGDASWIVLFA